MLLNDFKLLKEDDDSYHLHHPAGRKIVVSKKGLNDRAHAAIKSLPHFDEGGVALPVPTPDLEPTPVPDETPTPAPGETPVPVPDEIPTPDAAAPAPASEVPAAVSAEPPAVAAPAVDPLVQKGLSTEGVLNQQEKDIQDYQKAIGGAGAAQSGAYGEYAKQLARMQTPQQLADLYKQKDDELTQAFADNKIDPNRYVHSMDTGHKILAAIGLILGGAGAHSYGGHNLALDQLNRNIDQDIEAQKSNQNKTMTLWKMNRAAMDTNLHADLATKNQLLSIAQAKAMQATANASSATAKLRGQELISQLEQQKIQNRLRLGLLGQSSGGALSTADPATLVPQLVPEPQQKAVFDEISRAQNVGTNGPKIRDAFEKASGQFKGVPWTPNGVKAFHQLLLPNFKTIDGTVRQAAMDETFANLTPQFGDSKDTLATKRNAMDAWLHSEAAAPTAKAYGINLGNFASTSSQGAPQIQTMGGIQYQKVPGGWKRVQ